MTWEVFYRSHTNKKGQSLVETWLDSLPNEQLESVATELALLRLAGNTLRLPHSKSLGKGLFELRERAYGLRLYYTFHTGRKIILLGAGSKSSQERDIKRARKIMDDLIFLEKINET